MILSMICFFQSIVPAAFLPTSVIKKMHSEKSETVRRFKCMDYAEGCMHVKNVGQGGHPEQAILIG